MTSSSAARSRPGGGAGALTVLLLLAAWLGGALVTAAVVAPAAFAVLPSRALAGALVGRVLPVLFLAGAVAAVLTGWVAMRTVRSRRRTSRVVAAVVLAGACLLAQLAIAPSIERVRVQAGVPIDALARTDARRVAFGRLHGASVAALGVAMLAAAVALALGGRELAGAPGGRDGAGEA